MEKPLRSSTENITWRAILLGLLSLPLNIYLVVQTETVWTTQYPTTMAIFFNAVFTLFLVTIFNLLLTQYFPKMATDARRNVDGIPHGDACMRRLWT